MILKALYDLCERLEKDPSYEVTPPGFSRQQIAFRVVIQLDGTLVAIEDARVADTKGVLRNAILLVPGDAKPSGSGINPGLLWDNQTYMLGRLPDEKAETSPDFGTRRFDGFRKRHLDLEKSLNSPTFSAVCRFLETWSPERLKEFPVLTEVGTGFGVFQIQGHIPPAHEASEILAWWRSTLDTASEAERGQCLITGEVTEVARLHPKIKQVSGAQSAGAMLVSFQGDAYRSYGKKQGLNAPVGQSAAFRYGAALNSLLSGPQKRKHRIEVGDTTAVFWTSCPSLVEDCLAEYFSHGSESIEQAQDQAHLEAMKRLMQAIQSGSGFLDSSESSTGFFILGLAANAARLSVRFFHRSSVEELTQRLHEHHTQMAIVRQFETATEKRPADPLFPAISRILRETARDANDIPPVIAGALTRSIITGCLYPESLMAAIMRRIRADRTINYIRASTIKAILIRNHQQKISIMIDQDNTNPAYLLGRMFAALEKTQDDALGKVNAGIRDRFYGSASATPAVVFPRLLRTYQHHLSKLDGGRRVSREKLMQEIVAGLDKSGFPSQLNIKEQGLFTIGYYHQRKAFFTTVLPETTPSSANSD